MLSQKSQSNRFEPKGLVFDCDGTLADTMPLHFIAWMEASKRHGFPFDEVVFQSMAGMPALKIIATIAREHGLVLDPLAVAADKEAGFVRLIPQVEPIDPVVQVVKRCFGKLPMALGTGGTREIAWKTIDAAGLRRYFDILVSSQDVSRHKPEPDTFLQCAERMGIAPEHCQVFEDADLGLEAARRAGMIPCDVRPWIRDAAARGISPERVLV